jgi:spermidine/putrescine transport system permease protein
MLVFLPSLGMFYVPEILGGAKNMLLGTFIKNQFLVVSNWPLGAAASSVLTLLLVLMAGLYRLAALRVAGRERKSLLSGGLPGGLAEPENEADAGPARTARTKAGRQSGSAA